MKQILMVIAAVMLVGQPVLAAVKEPLISDPFVEKAIRRSLKKPEGELTEADFAKVTSLFLAFTKITDDSLKEVAKMEKLEKLLLNDTKVTKAGVTELKKALPKCRIGSNPKK